MKFETQSKGTRLFGAAASLFGSSEKEQVLDAIPARVAVIDAMGQVRSVNATWRTVEEDFFSHAFDSGLNYLELCDSTRGENARAAWTVAKGLRAVLSGSEPDFSLQYSWQFESGRRQFFKCTISPLGGRTFGSPRGAVVMHVDIEGPPQAEPVKLPDALDGNCACLADRIESPESADPARHIGMVANTVPALMSYVDASLIYRAVNRSYEKWFAAPAADIVGMSMADVAGEALFRRVEPHARAALAGEKVTFEDSFEDGVGERRWFRATYVPDIDAEGRVHGFCTLTYDITPLKEIERRLAEAKVSAEKSPASQTAFLANVDRELRSPLLSIIGFSQTLASELFGPIGEQYRAYAKDIRDTACELTELVSNLGDLSLIQSGQLALDEARIDLGALIAASLPRAEAVAGEANVTLETHLPDKMIGLFADERMVRMVVVNLLINSIQMANTGGRVHLSVHHESDGSLSIVVADHDRTVSPSDLDRMMEPFGHSNRNDSHGSVGAGLALPLARHYMELHNGSLTVSHGAKGGFSATAAFPRARVSG